MEGRERESEREREGLRGFLFESILRSGVPVRRRWRWWQHYTVSRHTDASVCRWLCEQEQEKSELCVCD
jgi:hypothetical protein